MIYVIATVELNEGGKEKYLAELKRVMPLVHKEKGCLEYGPTVDVPTGIPIQVPLMFLGLLTSVIQALVFTLLSTVYIALMLPHHEHAEEHGAPAHAH